MRCIHYVLSAFHPLLVKIDKNEVKMCGRKSIVYKKDLVYNKNYEKLRKF